MGINHILQKLKKSILITVHKIKLSNKKGNRKNKKNFKPPTWGSPI